VNARKLIKSASFAPEAMKAIERAFDEAWASVAVNFASGQAESASVKLARAVLLVAGVCAYDDAAVLRDVALRLLSDYYGIL
jgi:hypothetical protein